MIDALATAVLTGLLVWLVTGALLSLLYPAIRPLLLALSPSQSSRLLLGWLGLPLLAGLSLCALLYWPDLAQQIVREHCHAGGCQQHGPSSTFAIWPATLLSVWVVYRLSVCLFHQWLPTYQLRRQLDVAGRKKTGFIQLDHQAPAAFTLGWWRPSIFLTQGLVEQCSDNDIRGILEHEKAHQERRDNLRLLLVHLFTAPLPKRWVASMMADHQLCCEQACDLTASQHLSRDSIADTLLHVSRLQQQAIPVGATAFGDSHTELRILALLDNPKRSLSTAAMVGLSTSVPLFLLLLVNPLHELVEYLH